MKAAFVCKKRAIMDLSATLKAYSGRQVILDTAGSTVYLGTLKEVAETGFWLENADIHDCSEGHAGKEAYVFEAKINGIRTNRKRLFVMRSAAISIAVLDDVVQEDLGSSEQLAL
ncbi:MAG: hypothetical protein IIB58_00195 [Planctomycetes bacterium]|nr:hypothetical protein [Planctomycetota bacterium]